MSRYVKDGEHSTDGESFLQRFHRRKTEARQQLPETAEPGTVSRPISASDAVAGEGGSPPAQPALTDADMPPLESLGEDSDYTGFLSEQVSEALRKAALRKLFHGASFNITDGLDEYADDFTTFEALGDIVTADMRHLIEVEARKKAEQAQRAVLSEDGGIEVDAAESPTALQETSETDGEPEETTPTLATTPEPPLLSAVPDTIDATLSRTTES